MYALFEIGQMANERIYSYNLYFHIWKSLECPKQQQIAFSLFTVEFLFRAESPLGSPYCWI